jgi:23S rRNA pseudouridine2457 synthase
VFNQKLTNPKSNKMKTYHVQVEKIPSEHELKKLEAGVVIKGYKTKPCRVKIITEPTYPERVPPIRKRKNIPTSWLEMTLIEGKNRQVRRMTAAIGYPTLRLIRVAMGKLNLLELDLKEGQFVALNKDQIL